MGHLQKYKFFYLIGLVVILLFIGLLTSKKQELRVADQSTFNITLSQGMVMNCTIVPNTQGSFLKEALYSSTKMGNEMFMHAFSYLIPPEDYTNQVTSVPNNVKLKSLIGYPIFLKAYLVNGQEYSCSPDNSQQVSS